MGWLDKYNDTPKAQDGTVILGSPEYAKAYREGTFADVPNPLEPVTITADKKTGKNILDQYPYYDQLTKEEKKYFNDKSSIGRAVRRKAYTKKDLAGDAANMPIQLLQGAGEMGQVPQSAMVEGIEYMRGKPYDFSTISPSLAGDLGVGDYNAQQRMPSEAWGFDTTDKPWYHPKSVSNFAMDAIVDPTLITGGAGLVRKPLQKGLKQGLIKTSEDIVSSPTNKIIKEAVQPIQPITELSQVKELPGLHLKSTMEGQAISKIVEPKTGLVNVEQALAIIGKESGGADKVALIKQGLGDNIPNKMDFNEFRKTVQDQLIPLEKSFNPNASSHYGITRLGYQNHNSSGYRIKPYDGPLLPRHYQQMLDNIDSPKNYYKGYGDKYYIEGINNDGFNTIDDAKTWIKNTTDTEIQKRIARPLENQTLILSNKNKFGIGSSAHNNPNETLGHVHFLRDFETPDVLTVTQIQSDAFQGSHRIMPKVFNKEQQMRVLAAMEQSANKNAELVKTAKKIDDNTWELADGTKVSKDAFEFFEKGQLEYNNMKRAEIENFAQKSLLDKNHQERYLQELVDYAGKRGDVNKMRVPTSETAAKVQNYSPLPEEKLSNINTELAKLKNNEITSLDNLSTETLKHIRLDLGIKLGGVDAKTGLPSYISISDLISEIDRLKGFSFIEKSGIKYMPEHQTILKKYSQQPKTIKKLFGEEPKTVTDNKGNTWYEFDIPKKFKEGKGEIKAFSAIPGAIGAAALSQQPKEQFQQQFKNGGWLDSYQDGGVIEDDRGQWAHPGKVTKINSNVITMQGVNYPVLGISDVGDVQLMQPEQDYKFKGEKVTELPLARFGTSIKNKNNLHNFTQPTTGGWLDKYN